MSLLCKTFPLIPLRSKPLPPLLFLAFLLLKSSLPNPTITIFSVSASTTPTPPIPIPKPPIPLQWVTRTGFCGELSTNDVGKRVTLCGWVALHRVHGGLTFLNLRDHTGTVQVTTLPDTFPDAHSAINDLRLEYVVAVEGLVRSRPVDSVNKKMKTGWVEIAAEHVQVLNAVRSKLPFLVTTEAKDSVKEEIRLRYVFLDTGALIYAGNK